LGTLAPVGGMQEVQKLPDLEKDKITSLIDAFIRDTRAKKAYGMA